jgi:outer membrane autotransporter protein
MGGFVNVGTTTTIASQASSHGTLNLNSTAGVQGILATTQLVGGNGTRAVNFNGGILRAKANQTNFITGFSAGELQLLTNGLTIDSNGFNLSTSSVFSGAGGLTKQGTGTLTLLANNLYSGDTSIAAGTLVLGGGTTTGSVAGNIVNNATLQFSRTNDLSYSGSISGSGSVIQAGTGTVTLLGTNNYTGLTTISSGILQIGNGGTSGNISGDIANNAGLVFNRSDNLTYAAVISGSGSIVQSGAGRLILNGTNGAFLGTTTVQNGALEVNGTLGGTILITSLGTVGGTGTLNELTVNGIIAPGHSIGSLTVVGNYTQAPGSVYEVEINPQGQSDLINVSQTATINGGTVEVVKEAGIYVPGTRYNILTAGGGVSGVYTNLSQANLPFLNLSLNYDNNHVFLDIARNIIPDFGPLPPAPFPIPIFDTTLASPTIVRFASVAFTPNQINTANAIESLAPLDSVFLSVLNAPDEQSARLAFDNLSGEIYVSTLGVFLEESRYVRDAVLNRLQQAFSFSPVVVDEKFGHQQQVSMDSGLSLWTDGFGSWGNLQGNFNAAQLNRSTGGSFLGGDLRITEALRAGILGGYSNSNFTIRARNSYGNSDNYHLGAYAGTEINHWGLRIGGVYTWQDVNQFRNVIFPHFASHLKAAYNAHTTQVFAEAGYNFKARYLTLEPFAGLAYVGLNNNVWHESASPAALQGNGNEEVTYSTFGLREKAQLYQTEHFLLSEKVILAWRHAYGQVNPHSALNFASGSLTFLIGGSAIAKDSLLINAGIDLNPVSSRNLFFSLDYSGQIAAKVKDHGVFGSIRWRIS